MTPFQIGCIQLDFLPLLVLLFVRLVNILSVKTQTLKMSSLSFLLVNWMKIKKLSCLNGSLYHGMFMLNLKLLLRLKLTLISSTHNLNLFHWKVKMSKKFDPHNLDDWMNLLKTAGIVLTAIWTMFLGD